MTFIIEDLSKGFKSTRVLKNLDYKLEVGKLYCLVGRNGVGKTTLFSCLNGDLKANNGHTYFEINGQEMPVKYGDINYVLSEPTLSLFLTGYEFLDFFLEFNKDLIVRQPIEYYFDLINFKYEDYNKLIKDYSLGMKNKLQLLVNIIVHPKLLLLDEALASFDILAIEEMKKLLTNLKNKFIIISTHLLDLAYDLADEILILNNGSIQTSINPKNIAYQELKENIIQALE